VRGLDKQIIMRTRILHNMHESRRVIHSGFTLLELMVVLSIIAVGTALLVSGLRSNMPSVQLRQASNTVAEELRFTRNRAMASGESQLFEIDADTREWRSANDRTGLLNEDLRVTAVAARVEQTQPSRVGIRFFPDGASTGGRITLEIQGAKKQVDVDWLLGNVRISTPGAPP
jgi:general secretion pathway protein H